MLGDSLTFHPHLGNMFIPPKDPLSAHPICSKSPRSVAMDPQASLKAPNVHTKGCIFDLAGNRKRRYIYIFYIVFRLWKRIYLLHRIYDYKLYTPTVNIYLSKTPLPLGGFEGCFVFSPAGGMMRPAGSHDFRSKLLWTVCIRWAL